MTQTKFTKPTNLHEYFVQINQEKKNLAQLNIPKNM